VALFLVERLVRGFEECAGDGVGLHVVEGCLRLRVGWFYVLEAWREVLVMEVWVRVGLGLRDQGLRGGRHGRKDDGLGWWDKGAESLEGGLEVGQGRAPCCWGSKLSPRSLRSWMRLATRARLAT
jgi:hypothetical protein